VKKLSGELDELKKLKKWLLSPTNLNTIYSSGTKKELVVGIEEKQFFNS